MPRLPLLSRYLPYAPVAITLTLATLFVIAAMQTAWISGSTVGTLIFLILAAACVRLADIFLQRN